MTSSSKRRVVITGLGVVTDVGNDVPTMWRAHLGRASSGIGPITCVRAGAIAWTVTIAGEVRDWDRLRRSSDTREATAHGPLLSARHERGGGSRALDCGIDFATPATRSRRGRRDRLGHRRHHHDRRRPREAASSQRAPQDQPVRRAEAHGERVCRQRVDPTQPQGRELSDGDRLRDGRTRDRNRAAPHPARRRRGDRRRRQRRRRCRRCASGRSRP